MNGFKKISIAVLLVALPIGAAVFLGKSKASAMQARAMAPGEPYTVQVKETNRRAGKPFEVTATQTFMRYQGGTTVNDTEQFIPGREDRIITMRHAGGLEELLRPVQGYKSTVKRTGDNLLKIRLSSPDPAADCVKSFGGDDLRNSTRIPGFEDIKGVRTVHLVSDNGQRHQWLAPDFGCVMVQMRWQYPLKDGIAESNQDLVFATRGEPGMKPGNYGGDSLEEVSLAEFHMRHGRRLFGPAGADLGQGVRDKLEKFYWSNRP